ncbi:MAG: RluA family pseudouridine synthase [Phycisphaerales bacterium]
MTSRRLEILYATTRLVWINKPAGLLSVPGKGADKADCVVARVAARFGWARETHRLDQETSGVMLVALDPDAHRMLSRQFRERGPEKEYEAIVAGRMEAEEGTIDLPMRADIERRPIQIIDHEHGKAALTRWEVIDRESERTRLRLRPHTGRSHQLRVHLAALGHPILGDSLYADEDARVAADRMLLHATRLVVTDPGDGERVAVDSPAPF